MKRHILIFAAAAAFSATACSNEKTAENTAVENRDESLNDADGKLAGVAGLPEEVNNHLQEALQEYLILKDAFVASNEGNAQKAAATLAEAINRINPESMPEDQQNFMREKVNAISENAEKMVQAPGLDEQRKYFDPVSEAIYALIKTYKISGEQLYYQHCPMANNNKGGYWVSAHEEIRNPYFGDQMLSCGSTKETLNK